MLSEVSAHKGHKSFKPATRWITRIRQVTLTWEITMKFGLMPPDTEGTGFNTGLSEPLELKALSSERPNFIHKTSTHSKELVTTGSTAVVLAVNRMTQGVPFTYTICECMQQVSVPWSCALQWLCSESKKTSQKSSSSPGQCLSPTRGCKIQSFFIPAWVDLSGQTSVSQKVSQEPGNTQNSIHFVSTLRQETFQNHWEMAQWPTSPSLGAKWCG